MNLLPLKTPASPFPIRIKVGSEGYPPDLETLVEGVAANNDATGRKLKFLRKVPVDPMTHKGEELCVVLSGAIRYRLGEEIVDLSSSEFVHFKSEIKHSWENVHPRATRVLWVFSDGLSF